MWTYCLVCSSLQQNLSSFLLSLPLFHPFCCSSSMNQWFSFFLSFISSSSSSSSKCPGLMFGGRFRWIQLFFICFSAVKFNLLPPLNIGGTQPRNASIWLVQWASDPGAQFINLEENISLSPWITSIPLRRPVDWAYISVQRDYCGAESQLRTDMWRQSHLKSPQT